MIMVLTFSGSLDTWGERFHFEVIETVAARPHQGLGNVIPLDFDYPAEPAPPTQVQSEEALGGLLNHYWFKQAA